MKRIHCGGWGSMKTGTKGISIRSLLTYSVGRGHCQVLAWRLESLVHSLSHSRRLAIV